MFIDQQVFGFLILHSEVQVSNLVSLLNVRHVTLGEVESSLHRLQRDGYGYFDPHRSGMFILYHHYAKKLVEYGYFSPIRPHEEEALAPSIKDMILKSLFQKPMAELELRNLALKMNAYAHPVFNKVLYDLIARRYVQLQGNLLGISPLSPQRSPLPMPTSITIHEFQKYIHQLNTWGEVLVKKLNDQRLNVEALSLRVAFKRDGRLYLEFTESVMGGPGSSTNKEQCAPFPTTLLSSYSEFEAWYDSHTRVRNEEIRRLEEQLRKLKETREL